jgi:hypothetical protein
MDLGAACGFQGLRLGQGGLILGRHARITNQGHQNNRFAVLFIATKRPFASDLNEMFLQFGKLCHTSCQ